MTQKKWYKTPLYITLIATVLFILASLVIPALGPVLHAFIGYWKIIWWAILLGFFLAGVIDAFIPSYYITHFLSRPHKSSIFYATILGVIMSACSHGLLAIAMQLYKKGASTASVIAFLLASPWANIGITLLLFSLFGIKAFAFILAALVIAVTTGLIYQKLEHKKYVESNPHLYEFNADFSLRDDFRNRWENRSLNIKEASTAIAHGAWHSVHMVLWWVIIGTLIGSFMEAFIPKNLMQDYMGPSLTGLAITLIVATVIEVCSEGSSPIAFTIYKQTGAFGNSFVFLMAGVITDITELGLIWANIGKKAAIWLPIITIPQALFFGLLMNFLL